MLCSSSSKNIGNKKIFLALAVSIFFLLNISSVFAVTYATVEDVYGILGDGTSRTGAYNITFQVRSCDDSACSGESWSSDYTNSTYNDISSLSNNQYFQYQALFYTEDQNYTPMLFNATVGYAKNIYPTNVTLNIGNDSDTEWNQTGTFDYQVTIDDTNTTPTFTSELNDVLTNQCTCSGCELNTTDRTCKIPFVLSSATQGQINISDINIIYDLMSLNITAIDQNSNTIENAYVEIFTPTGNSTAWKTAYTDSDGKASFTTITGKTYDIKSSKTGYISNTENTNVGPNGTYTLSMTALIDYVKVYLYNHNNNPISGKTVNLYLADNSTVYQTNTTDASGYTDFFVDVQNYDLRIDPDGWNRFYEDILPPDTKRLYGLLVNVTNQNAQAVNNAQVWVYEAGTTTSYNGNTNSSGMLTFGLKNQSYDISTFKQGVFSRLLRQNVPSTANVELDLTLTEYLEDINATVHAINDTITNTIIPYLQEINTTTHNSYDYLQDTIYPKVNDANSTIYDVLDKWGIYNASQIYERINDTYNKADDVYTDTQALLSKWGTYTAQQLYNISNLTYQQTVDIYNDMATASALSSMQTDVTWLINNVATQENMTLINSKLDTMDSTIDIIKTQTNCSAPTNSELCTYLDNTNSTVDDIKNNWGSYTTEDLITRLNEVNTTTQNNYDYLQNTVYTKLNLTYNNTQQTLTYIGNPSDSESANTLFGEHQYTQNRLTEINGNLTYLVTLTEHINDTITAINSTVSTILLEVDDLEELHQCSISPNSTICTLLNNIKTDTGSILTLTTNINTTVSSLGLFEISALVAGSPRYANEEALIEATFTGQNGSYVTPDTINITIYDPNKNIWQTATKAQFTEGSYHIWIYSKSISATPTTGMYTVHMLASYQEVSASKSAQFRIATGGPYKVYLECPSSSYVGQNLVCNVILQDEGEVPTESTSTVWVDTDNDGVADAGEPQSSFSKQTTPQQNVTQSVSINVPSNHATGLYVVRVDTSYANSAQPNSGASDSVTFSTAPAEEPGGGPSGSGAGGVPTITVEEKEGKIQITDFPEKIEIIKTESLEKTIGIKNIGDGNLNNVKLVISGLPLDSYTIFPEKYDVIPPGATQTFLITFKADINEKEYPIKFIVTSDEGSEEVSSVLVVKEKAEVVPEEERKIIPEIIVPSYWLWILLILIVLGILTYLGIKKKEVIRGLFERKHKPKKKVTEYHLLNTKNIIIAVLAVIVLASILFNISIKEIPLKIINFFSAIELPSVGISINWWFILGVLIVLFLAGIFVVLILILQEIRKLTAGKRLKPQNKSSKNILLIIGIIVLIVLFLLMLISNSSITGNVVGVANTGKSNWLPLGFILIIGIIGLLIYNSRKKNKEIFQEVKNIEEKPIEKKTEIKSLHQDIQNLQSSIFKVKPSVRERLEKMQGLDKPNPDKIRTNVYKMLEENGINIGSPKAFQKSQKTEQPNPEIQAKKITAVNKQDMLAQLKGVYE